MERLEMRRGFAVILILGLGCSACSSKEETSPDIGLDLSRQDISIDQNSLDFTTTDTSNDLVGTDIGADFSKDGAADTGDMPDLRLKQLLTLTRTKDGVEFPFTDFYYGKNLDETLRLELFVKGTGSCPTMMDPTPEETMILNIDPITKAHNDAVLLDFEGHFETLSPNHSSTLIVGQFTFDAFGETVEMELEGVDKHEISHFNFKGKVYATYCPSLDE